MFRRIAGAIVSFAVTCMLAATAQAQGRVEPGYVDLGFTLADASSYDAGTAFGIRGEKLLKTMPSLGGGVLGVQLSLSASLQEFGLGHKWLYMPFGAAATYHFRPGDGSFDPFLAAGAGYRFTSCVRYINSFADCSGEDSEVFGIARVGAKLFTSTHAGFTIDAGLGSSYVSGGVVLRLR